MAFAENLSVLQFQNTMICETGNYHVCEMDESDASVEGPPGGDCTRIAVANHGSLAATVEYCKHLCLGLRSPFAAFSLNPEQTWFTMKTSEGEQVTGLNWTTWTLRRK